MTCGFLRAGSANGAAPPSLVVTVTGQASHPQFNFSLCSLAHALAISYGTQVSHGPNPTPAAGSINPKNFDHLPRVFSQSFILVYTDPTRGEDGYSIVSDSFRFC